ncbi:MAG: glycosyltransferase family 4 protein [Microcoleaceae cyanobacterium]
MNWVNLGSPEAPSPWQKPRKLIQKVASVFSKENQNPQAQYEQFIQKVQRQLQKTPCDLIYAPVASQELSFFETDIPIVYWSDATAKLIHETYKLYSDEAEFRQAAQRDQTAISKAKTLVYSSEWAANSAIQDYGANPAQVKVMPLGANVDIVPAVADTLQKCQAAKCRLLFIGKDWQRKGGSIAYETLLALLDRGVDAELLLIGCVPPPEFQHEKLNVIPFLNKNIPQEQQQFSQLLLESHFLIFPTRADCSPIVICEANAYGIPVMTTNVGGIPTIIREGKNGYMFPLSASGDQYAELIAATFADKDRYQQLVLSSRAEYDARLNWEAWAKTMHQIMVDTLG